MRLRALWMAAALAGLAWAMTPGDTARGGDDKGGTDVEMDGLHSRTPASWKKEEVPPRLAQFRLAQFRLPKKGDDADDAELLIFKGFGGSAKQNVDRWKGQFVAPEGKGIDDVSKVEELRVAGHGATYLDVHGTYLFKARPFDPNEKPQKKPDYRMLAVQFEGPDNTYHIKLTGPAKTIEEYKKGFDDWLKGFKKE
jgi:hypothetical protein